AIVKVPMSRIDDMIDEGRKGARSAKKVISHVDHYLSACQLGITVATVGLGWLGAPLVEQLLHSPIAQLNFSSSATQILSFIIAFAIIAFLHVVLGELVPKRVATQKAEKITIACAVPMVWFYRIMFPFIWFLNISANLVVRLLGLKPASKNEVAHSEEELR